MTNDDPSRISISRDALRADLAEMELRLRVYFDERLGTKASDARVAVLEERMNARERGELTAAQVNRVEEIARQVVSIEDAQGWTTKERVMAVTSSFVAIGMLLLSLVLAVQGGKIL